MGNDAHYQRAEETGLWSEVAGNTNPLAVALLLSRARLAGKTVVDVACGDAGAVARASRLPLDLMLQLWEQYVGVDAFGPALKRLNVPLGRPVHIPPLPGGLFAEPLNQAKPCQPDMADVVLCLFLLQDLARDDGRSVLANLGLLVKEGGQLILALTVHRTQNGANPGHNRKLEKLSGAVVTKHKEDWTSDSLTRQLDTCGFKIIDEVSLPGKDKDRYELYVRAVLERKPPVVALES